MMNPVELWQRILTTPADAGLKTQYVAALTEAGDRRADVFALAAEYKRLRDGSYIDAAQELKPCLDALIADWRADFAPRTDAWPGEIQFVLGWPIELTMKAADFARHAEDIVATVPVRHLNLNDVSELPAVFDVPRFGQIASLDGSKQIWSDDAIRALARSSRLGALRWLDLSHGGITEAQVEILAASAALRGLQMLDLSNNPTRDPGRCVGRLRDRLDDEQDRARIGRGPGVRCRARGPLRQDRLDPRPMEFSRGISAQPVQLLSDAGAARYGSLRRAQRRAKLSISAVNASTIAGVRVGRVLAMASK